jgi:[acyl-carrier-protein] S-malonyltransferase
MQEAVPFGTGAMAAIIGGDLTEIQRICNDAAGEEICSLANLNSPNQVVIAGNAGAVDRAIELLTDVAKRVVKLNVSAPFHCALMKPAQERLAINLDEIQFENARVPVVTNADAKVTTEAAALRDALYRQVSAPVRWSESMELLIGKGIGTFIEVGPGKVLTGLMRQISREVTCLNVEDTASLESVKTRLDERM